MLLRVCNLAKNYEFKEHFYKKKQLVTVFKDVNFELDEAQTLLISGKSGVGKSTLARVLCMLEQPSFGQVFFKDINLFSLNFKEQRKLRKDLQFIFAEQKLALNPYKTVKKLIFECGRNFDVDFSVLDELLKELDLDKKLFALKANQLSGGELKKVALLRALLLEPKLLILDELTSSLDLQSASKILNLLKNLQDKTGISYIFITHQPRLFKGFCAKMFAM